MPNDCTAPAVLEIAVLLTCTVSVVIAGIPYSIMSLVKYTKQVANKTRGGSKTAAKIANVVNAIDKASYGALLNNPIAQTIVPYANMVQGALTVYDSLMSDLMGPTAHPQISGGTVAGVSQTVRVGRSAPKITGSRGNIRIMHKELVSEVSMTSVVSTSPTYVNGTSIYQVNPSNASLFPWLSTIAENYDYYNFHRVTLVYVPLCATSQTGRVMLGFDPDGSDPIPYDRQALSSYKCSTDFSAWGVNKLELELPHNLKWYNSNSSSGALQSIQNQGQAFVATWTGSANVVGEIYVLYDVSLKDPQPTGGKVYEAWGDGTTITSNFLTSDPAAVSSTTATAIRISFTATGSYMVSMFCASTAIAAPSVAGNISLVEKQFVTNGGGSMSIAIVNATNVGTSTAAGVITTPALLEFSGLTALAKWTVFVTRAPYQPTYFHT